MRPTNCISNSLSRVTWLLKRERRGGGARGGSLGTRDIAPDGTLSNSDCCWLVEVVVVRVSEVPDKWSDDAVNNVDEVAERGASSKRNASILSAMSVSIKVMSIKFTEGKRCSSAAGAGGCRCDEELFVSSTASLLGAVFRALLLSLLMDEAMRDGAVVFFARNSVCRRPVRTT
jgi:hypothetical protein